MLGLDHHDGQSLPLRQEPVHVHDVSARAAGHPPGQQQPVKGGRHRDGRAARVTPSGREEGLARPGAEGRPARAGRHLQWVQPRAGGQRRRVGQ